jgi:ribosomal-protein-alanine N-acetyltransferase
MVAYPPRPFAEGGVELRPWAVTDLPLVEEAANDPLLRTWTTLPKAYKRDEGLAFIERQLNRQRTGEGLSLCITSDEEPVGCATLMFRRAGVADLGYWLVARARGSGVGTQAVTLLVRWAAEREELDAIEAFVADDNIASRRLLERIGFRDAGMKRHEVNDLVAVMRAYRRETPTVGRRS